MAFFPRKKNNRRRKPLRKRAAGARKSSVSAGVKDYVKRAIHTTVENKCVQINASGPFGNVNESPDFNAYPMCPLTGFWTINQGVGQGARIGNIIKTRKVYLNYVLRPLPYSATTNPQPNPCEVQLMLGYVKNTPCFNPVSGDISFLFQSGSSSAGPIGTLRDIVSVINKDYWVIKKRWTHKVGYAAMEGTGANPGNQFQANNDFKLNHVARIDITKHIPKTHVFNDGSSSTNTRNLFLMYYAVAADGGTYGANGQVANIEFWIDFHYEDA
jgi:hypothetical protein